MNFKKILLPLIATVIVVAGVFAMNAKKKGLSKKESNTHVSYKWFSISGNHTTTSQVPQSDAVYLGEGTTPPAGSGDDCPDGVNYDCVAGFNPSQVNSSNQLINNSQVPQTVPYLKD